MNTSSLTVFVHVFLIDLPDLSFPINIVLIDVPRRASAEPAGGAILTSSATVHGVLDDLLPFFFCSVLYKNRLHTQPPCLFLFVFLIDPVIADHKDRKTCKATDEQDYPRSCHIENAHKCTRPHHQGIANPHDAVLFIIGFHICDFSFVHSRPGPEPHRLFAPDGVYTDTCEKKDAGNHDSLYSVVFLAII